MLNKKLIRYFSYFIFSLILLPLVIGCSTKPQPKAWLSIEKAPMRVIFVDNERDIKSETVHRLVNQMKDMKFDKVEFNQDTFIGMDHDIDYSISDNVVKSLEVK